jgi:hypothetical protein
MPTWDADIIQVIDQRIAQSREAANAAGVFVTHTTSSSDGLVVFDGSQAPMPTKVAGDVTVAEGDRVLMTKYGRWWVIVAAMPFRGTRKLEVADKSARLALGNLTEGDEVQQYDTNITYQWTGSQWIVRAGESVFAWVRGPAEAVGHRLLSNVTGQQSAYTTAAIEVEPNNLYLIDWSVLMQSGVGGTHFFKSYIFVGGSIVARSGEFPYTGGNVGQRTVGVSYPYITGGSETSLTLELRVEDGSASAYDAYADPTEQAYLLLSGAGRAASIVAT